MESPANVRSVLLVMLKGNRMLRVLGEKIEKKNFNM